MLSSSGSAKAPALLAPSRSGVAPVPLRRPRRKLIPARSQSGQHAGGSFDSSEDLDYNLAQELDAVAQPDKYAAVAKHLNLLYDASERNKVEPCLPCRGSGEQECDWCHGTGAMTIGDTLYCSDGGCTPCPVCRGTGACQCPHCRGTGKRATWLTSGSW